MPTNAAKDLGASHSFCASLASLVTKTVGFRKGIAQCLEVDKRPVFIYSDGADHCCDVIAIGEASIHRLYSYNLSERRWMTGSRPKAHRQIVLLLEIAASTPALSGLRGDFSGAQGGGTRPESRRSRRSSRVKLDVLVELQDERFAFAGQTSVVNLHGALIRTSAALKVGNAVTIHVHQTAKSAPGRVVFASYEKSQLYGIELNTPENIWGMVDMPEDWGATSSADCARSN